MISTISMAAGFFRPQAAATRPTLTPADAAPPENPASPADTPIAPAESKTGIPVSGLKRLDCSLIAIEQNQAIRDRLATAWLNEKAADARLATDVPDNAPQNTYATIKVNGQVVATLYNSGCSETSSAAWAKIEAAGAGPENEPNLVGPNLAKWRAQAYAKALGGTIEMADTAKAQSEWTPRADTPVPTYTREQLDQAFVAMQAEWRNLYAQPAVPHGSPASTDVTA
jgi:hypothetical protein